VASFLRARALFDAGQQRKALAELERVAATCDRLGYHRFLRAHTLRAAGLVEYAVARHIAEPLLNDLQPERVREAHIRSDADAHSSDNADMVPAVRALAFGRGAVLVAERQVSDLEWRSEKSKEMFFFLLSRREAVGKEEIFTALWPDLPESKCNSNFHSSLYRLRRALFHECVVRATDGGYELNPKGIFSSDVEAFDRAMAAADAAKDDGARADKLDEAVALYKGPFLASTYGEWVEPIRRSLEDRYIEALSELAAQKLRASAFEEALVLFKSLEIVDSYSDAAAYGIMRCYIGLNDAPAAARQYRRFRQLLKDELDEEPSERLTALYRDATPS
jgi:LuxR family transcriptional regulator, maltose regulon positive regulatory protein